MMFVISCSSSARSSATRSVMSPAMKVTFASSSSVIISLSRRGSLARSNTTGLAPSRARLRTTHAPMQPSAPVTRKRSCDMHASPLWRYFPIFDVKTGHTAELACIMDHKRKIVGERDGHVHHVIGADQHPNRLEFSTDAPLDFRGSIIKRQTDKVGHANWHLEIEYAIRARASEVSRCSFLGSLFARALYARW